MSHKPTKVTYYRVHKYKDAESEQEVHFQTQLYQIGVYGIVNNDPSLQGNYTPQQIRRLQSRLKKAQEEGKIKDLELLLPITVTDKTGYWKEVE